MGEWVVGPSMRAEVREVLARELDARDGDTVVLYPDGSVALGRLAKPAAAALVTSFLRPVSRRQRPRVSYLEMMP